jgi:hypothetical protein
VTHPRSRATIPIIMSRKWWFGSAGHAGFDPIGGGGAEPGLRGGDGRDVFQGLARGWFLGSVLAKFSGISGSH